MIILDLPRNSCMHMLLRLRMGTHSAHVLGRRAAVPQYYLLCQQCPCMPYMMKETFCSIPALHFERNHYPALESPSKGASRSFSCGRLISYRGRALRREPFCLLRAALNDENDGQLGLRLDYITPGGWIDVIHSFTHSLNHVMSPYADKLVTPSQPDKPDFKSSLGSDSTQQSGSKTQPQHEHIPFTSK